MPDFHAIDDDEDGGGDEDGGEDEEDEDGQPICRDSREVFNSPVTRLNLRVSVAICHNC